MLREFLEGRGFEVVCINGSMSMQERLEAQEQFAGRARILISTDAGGEGLNLQFCHVVINYDMPWNPMKLEQRIGRVDRIGQEHVVRAINFELADTVEHRVREVLEEKLAVIFRELGIDKTSDVLDSAMAGPIFDDLYVSAVLDPEAIESQVDEVVSEFREQAQTIRESLSLLGTHEEFDAAEAKRLMDHPLPYWVERMTVNYLRASGGAAKKDDSATWALEWPDGERMEKIVFTPAAAHRMPWARHLTLEHPRLRDLIRRFPSFAPGQRLPGVRLPGLEPGPTGYWSLWEIALHADDRRERKFLPLFVTLDGRALHPTARHIWESLLTADPVNVCEVDPEESRQAYLASLAEAQHAGKELYSELLRKHGHWLKREQEKAHHAYEMRKKAIERIGLPAVRAHRLRKLEEEARAKETALEKQRRATPELSPIVLLKVLEEGVG